MIGALLNERYRLDAEIGRGGMGTVYRAHALAQWAEAHLARGDAGDRARAQELLHEAAAEFATMGAPAYAARMQARLADLEPSAEP